MSGAAFIWFFLSLAICFSLTGMIILNKTNIEKLRMEQQALVQGLHIDEVIKQQLYKTYALAALVVQAEGRVKNFGELASFLLDHTSILNFLLAPDGIVSDVYPRTGNESIIGMNFFTDGPGNKEAMSAKETGRLVLGGPFTLRQGGEGLVGRMPVYIDTRTEKHKFWGLVSVTLKFPQILEEARLDLLSKQGFSYKLWRINPDTGEQQIIDSDFSQDAANYHFVDNHIRILNADWHLKIWPIKSWFNYPENISLIIASFFISVLVLFVKQNNFDLARMRTSLEILAQHDQLTGIFNRRWFMEISSINLDRSRRHKKECFVILFDLDNFRNINDTYGHLAGDDILVQTALSIKTKIRPYDVFARYGGEEFIISIFDTEYKIVINLAERLRSAIENENFLYENIGLKVTASFGVARITDYNLKRAIQAADEALYSAKRFGRNRIVAYSDLDP